MNNAAVVDRAPGNDDTRARRAAPPRCNAKWLLFAAYLVSHAANAAEPNPPPPTQDAAPPAVGAVSAPAPADVTTTPAAQTAARAPESTPGVAAASGGITPVAKPTRRLRTLTELQETKIAGSVTLTAIEPRREPALVTSIDSAMIDDSGARDLVDLLDIYVPGFQVLKHGQRHRVWGTRSINADNTKYLLLVNGRKVNDNYQFGAWTECMLPMLGDIESIDYVNGPGSALHGSGAVGGVINIKTRTADTIIPEGAEDGGRARVSQGFIDRASWIESEYARRLSNDLSLSVYYGIGQHTGLSGSDSDHRAPLDYQGTRAGDRLPGEYTANNGDTPYDNQLKHKFMVQLEAKEFKSWVRYTEATEDTTLETVGVGAAPSPHLGPLSRQFTWHNEWEDRIADRVTLKLEGGYQYTYTANRSQVTLFNTGSDIASANREDQVFARAVLRYVIDDAHAVAVGAESYYEWLDPINTNPAGGINHNARGGVFTEYQGRFFQDWTVFLGARYDADEYTKPGFSPRVALVWTPTEEDTFKISYTESFRDQPNANSHQAYQRGITARAPDEVITNYEFIYSRALTDHLQSDLGAYYYESELIGSSPTGGNPALVIVGKGEHYGLSAALTYKEDGLRLGISHNYDMVYSFERTPGLVQTIYVDNPNADLRMLAWSPHSSKFFAWVRVSEKFSIDGNLRIYWRYEGMEELYDVQKGQTTGGIPGYRNSSTFDPKFGPSFNLNLGCTYKFTPHSRLRFDAYNLLALFDRDLNIYRTRHTLDYYTMPATFSLTYEYRF